MKKLIGKFFKKNPVMMTAAPISPSFLATELYNAVKHLGRPNGSSFVISWVLPMTNEPDVRFIVYVSECMNSRIDVRMTVRQNQVGIVKHLVDRSFSSIEKIEPTANFAGEWFNKVHALIEEYHVFAANAVIENENLRLIEEKKAEIQAAEERKILQQKAEQTSEKLRRFEAVLA